VSLGKYVPPQVNHVSQKRTSEDRWNGGSLQVGCPSKCQCQTTEGTQSTSSNHWPGLILSSSTTALLTEGALLPLHQVSMPPPCSHHNKTTTKYYYFNTTNIFTLTFRPLSETFIRRSLFNLSSGSCYNSDATWQVIGRTCGSACSSPRPGSRIAVLRSKYVLPL